MPAAFLDNTGERIPQPAPPTAPVPAVPKGVKGKGKGKSKGKGKGAKPLGRGGGEPPWTRPDLLNNKERKYLKGLQFFQARDHFAERWDRCQQLQHQLQQEKKDRL